MLDLSKQMLIEHKFFSQARLRLDGGTSDLERQRKVSELLTKLGLTACASTVIGTTGQDKVLSGGEKKRLAFATEVQIKKQCD
jgi:ABC-type multidrug transport system ATPase subunit